MMANEFRCLSCRKRFKGHFNRKRCEPCAIEKRTRPASTLTKAQIKKAKTMIGKMPRNEIATNLGVSLSSLKRAFCGTRLAYYNYCVINPKLVKDVNRFYEKHTLEETAKKFNFKPKQVDHIVHRYKIHRKLKQVRWTQNELIEAVKMAGLVSPSSQAKYFNRPNAFAGSIRSVWMKRFNMGQGCINGLVRWHSKLIVDGHKIRYIEPVGETRNFQPIKFRRLLLWVDIEKAMKPNCPEFIKEAVKTMADFQRWIWKSEDPRPLILQMIKERELA